MELIMENQKYGICQGRLIRSPNNELQWFPGPKWEEEFKLANLVGYKYVELLAERKHNPNNPIWSEDGISIIKEKMIKNNLIPYSICLDYVIDNPFINKSQIVDKTINYCLDFLYKAYKLNMHLVVLPLLEASTINQYNMPLYIEVLNRISKKAGELNLGIAIESLLSPDLLVKLIDSVDSVNVGAVYDTGNRALISTNPLEDIIKLKNRIYHIHLKDIRKPFGNVPIGTGIVDFLGIFKLLTDIRYKGNFSFESNRGEDPLETGSHNLIFIKYIQSLVK